MQGLTAVVDAVQREIGLVLRPFPVVLIPSEGRNLHGRGAHKADVRVLGVEAHVVLLPGPHTLQACLQAGFVLVLLFKDGTQPAASGGLSGGFKLRLQRRHLLSHIYDAPQEEKLQARDGDFIGP